MRVGGGDGVGEWLLIMKRDGKWQITLFTSV